jgi:subtilase family serine protease
MKIPSVRRVSLLATLLAFSPFASAPLFTQLVFAQSVPLITQPVDEGQRVVLRGNTRPEVTAANDQGPVDDSLPLNGIELQLKRSPAQEQAAETLADDLQRAGSPQFHKWLTAEQYADQFGVAPQDITTISDWLTGHGFTVDDPSPSRMIITFSGTAGQVREAFGTEIHALVVKGVQHIANASDPSIPAALAPAIEGVVSLHDFRPRPMNVPKAQYTFPGVNFPFYAVVPADLSTIYDFNPLFAAGITGKEQTIALIEDSDVYNPADWNTFRNTLGLDAYKGASLTTVHPGRGCADPGANGDDDEAILDAEWASAAAPSADLQLVSCASTTTVFGVLIALQNLVNQRDVPSIMSESYAECEVQNGAAANAAFKAAYLQAVLEGVSVFVGAGDNGAALCDYGSAGPAQSGVSVNGFGSTAYNVAVGGTDFGDSYLGTNANYWSSTNRPTYGSALSYVPEIPWNDTCASTLISSFEGYPTPYGPGGFCASAFGASFLYTEAGSGGPSNCATGESDLGIITFQTVITGPTPTDGTCRGWKKPNWQNVLGNPSDGVRDLPDVSLFAGSGVWDHGYVYCDSDPMTGYPCVGAPDNWSLGGGTSFATPIMAGMQALVNQVWGGSQGNPAPIYYSLARQEYGNSGNKNCESFVQGGPAKHCVFNDVTVGDNDVDCVTPYNCYAPGAPGAIGVLSLSNSEYEPAFTAGVGWDFATGLGSVNAANLVLNPIWAFGYIP